jgi:hypothetical protein
LKPYCHMYIIFQKIFSKLLTPLQFRRRKFPIFFRKISLYLLIISINTCKTNNIILEPRHWANKNRSGKPSSIPDGNSSWRDFSPPNSGLPAPSRGLIVIPKSKRISN